MNSIKDCNLTITPRIYQKHAYDLMMKRYKELDDRTFHIVAPPGSGKTVLGILLLLRLKEKALILSPNRTISSQWEKTFNKFAVNTLDETYDCSKLISSSIKDNPEILSITYQAFSVKDKSGELHENAEKIVDYLIDNNFKTIVLDECHHLLNYWAEIIKKFIKKSGKDIVVIGLTATLPKDKSNKEKQAYLEIMEEVDYQVPIPAVVKDGNLSPFRDFPYFVTPTDSEMSFLQTETDSIFDLIKKIEKLSTEGILDYSLAQFCEIFIENPIFKEKDIYEPIDFNSFYLKEPDIAIAIVKYLDELTLTIPIEVIIQDEMEEDISIYDYATLFRFYIYYFLETKEKSSKIDALKKEILKIWKKAGYNLHKNRVTEIKNNILKVLQVSNAKIKAVETILKNEYEILQKELTGLVLTDFIFAHSSKKLKNIIEPESGGASGVFIHLSKTELFNQLTPIMITGKKVMLHPSLKDKFLEFNDKFNFIPQGTKNINYYYLDNPPSASKLLTFATELSYQGIIKLIIGTRSLLGEGYDNVKINTLIDLTVTSSFVSVNQIRGRALRKDPDKFDKVANIWEVISIIPDIKTGYYDLKRVAKKHNHFLSLSPKGIIEKGIEHLGIDLTNLGHIDTINKNSLKNSQDRGDTFVDWKIGEKYKDNFVHSIEFKEQKRKKHKQNKNEQNNKKNKQENISNMDNLYIKEIELNQNKRDDALKSIEPLATYRFNFYFLILFVFFILIFPKIDIVGRFIGILIITIPLFLTIKKIIKEKQVKKVIEFSIVLTFFLTNIIYSVLLLLFVTITIKYFNIFILKRESKEEFFNSFYIFLNMVAWIFLNMLISPKLSNNIYYLIHELFNINLYFKPRILIAFMMIFIFLFFIVEMFVWKMRDKNKIVDLKESGLFFYIAEFFIYFTIFSFLIYFNFGSISLLSLTLFFVSFFIIKKIIYRNLKGDYSLFLETVSKVIFESFQELEQINKNSKFSEIIKIEKKGKSTSILVEDEFISELFINSINQLFLPIFFQKYVVEYQNKFNPNKLDKNYFPVPDFFGKNKNSAIIFVKFWNKYISDGELIYIKNKKNFNEIKKNIMTKSLTISGKEKSLWM